jgi:tetratricopeptide (TPR) repeat protein
LSQQLRGFAELLRSDAAEALRQLMRGTASVGHLSAQEPQDVLASIVQSKDADSSLCGLVDEACLSLLDEYRTQFSAANDSLSDVDLAHLHSLVLVIRRLLPVTTIFNFHRRFLLWNGFFENFVIDSGFDLQREFLRILALSQEIATAHGLEPRRLMPLWLSICGESGTMGKYDAGYVRIALLGLRRLPLGDEFSSNEDFVLQGLARWAVSQRPALSAFEREWRLIEADFPRTVSFWTGRVQLAVTAAERELSERTQGQEQTFPLAAWWREDVDLHRRDRSLPKGIAVEPPAREDREILLRGIAEQYSRIESRLDRLMARHRAYADKTGDVFYLVRTACNVGMRLIHHGHESERRVRGARAVSLAALAFEYDPANVFAWSLMRDALVAAGRLADAQRVGWEAIRRFPEDEQWHTQLATVLAFEADKPDEAAALLRESIRLFPAHTYSWTQLATVLADGLDNSGAAREVLDDAVARGLSNEVTQSLLQKLDRGHPLHSRRKGAISPAANDGTLELPAAEARHLLFRFEQGLAAQDEVRAFLSTNASDAYLTYVGERVGISRLPFKTTFAFAFDEALREASPGALRALVATARPLEKLLIEEAMAVSEGRIVELSPSLSPGRQFDRWKALESALRQPDSSSQARKVLLRDFAASNLSTHTTMLAAA